MHAANCFFRLREGGPVPLRKEWAPRTPLVDNDPEDVWLADGHGKHPATLTYASMRDM